MWHPSSVCTARFVTTGAIDLKLCMNEWMKCIALSPLSQCSKALLRKKIVYHTLKWLWKMNVFILRLKVSQSVSLLRQIGKEFQKRGVQVEKALPPNMI
jgi:hypothetical protein